MALLKYNTSGSTSAMFSSTNMGKMNYSSNSNSSNNNNNNNNNNTNINRNNNNISSAIAPICLMCQPERHRWTDGKYKTPGKRRDRLVVIGRCQACLIPVDTHGVNCSSNAKCKDHPNENHVHWTCDGQVWVHPGPQAAISRRNRGNRQT